MDPARLAAFEVLTEVREADGYANLVLARVLREHRITGRDAAFATELVSGTLRRLASYDAIIDALVSRAPDAAVRDVLRLGAHQLLELRVPDHAAVSSTAELARSRVGHRAVGFVNAVMRRIAARDLGGWMDHLDASLAVRTSHPSWVVDELARALARPEELHALLAADNERPLVTLVARPGWCSLDELVEQCRTAGLPMRGPGVSPYSLVLEGGDPSLLPAVREGRAGVQDAGSQLAALVLDRAVLDGADRVWLDACAGPGGKAALLAALAAERGARLVAADRQPHRARLVAQACRVGEVPVVVADGTRPPWRPAAFDRVLLDVPCSGLGSLRRRPESRWRRTPADLEALSTLQADLLGTGLQALRPGGALVYATCSPVVAETAEVVSRVLESRADVVLGDAPALLPEVSDAESAHLPGAAQLWPHRHGTDAMFIALLRRR